jgi:hypothetical protein
MPLRTGTPQARATAVSDALTGMGDQPEAVKIAAVQAVGAPGRRATDVIWLVVVAGLVGLLFYSLSGIIDLLLDSSSTKSPDKLITIFTSTLTGLIGLFAPSPLQRGGGSGV